MTTQTAPQAMPEMIVDRSPELARGASERFAQGDTANVTMEAEGAVRGDGGRCALARVILATWEDVAEAHVEGEHPYLVFKDGTKGPITLWPGIIEWIGKFDRGENPDPVKIHLTRY